MADVAGIEKESSRPAELRSLSLTRRDTERSLVDSPSLSSGRLSRVSIAPPKSARFGRSAVGCRANSAEISPQDFPDGGTARREYLADQSGECGLRWDKPPRNVFVVKKFKDRRISQCFMKIAAYLKEKGLTVYVEDIVSNDKVVTKDKSFADVYHNLKQWSAKSEDAEHVLASMDLVICLGGDGTLLHISSLFQESVPPVLAFHLGSLGFLTPLSFDNFQQTIDRVLSADENLDMTLRSRLVCTIHRNAKSLPQVNWLAEELRSPTAEKAEQSSETRLLRRRAEYSRRESIIITRDTKTERMLVLNEVVIDRGSSPYLSSLDVYCNNQRITDVQGDGLIVATPTGSTAYAAAAGASMVHPSVQTMVVTPICPHSLSFRPIMVPGGVTMKIVIPPRSRGRGAVSCDGKNRQELARGDSVSITMSIWPLPCVNSVDHLVDWFGSLAKCLSWNVRQKQKPFPDDEDEAVAEEDDDADENV